MMLRISFALVGIFCGAIPFLFQGWLQVAPREFRFDIRENFFTKRAVRHGNSLSRAMAESSLLEAFKKCVDEALEDMV